jgi:hypothetical protein
VTRTGSRTLVVDAPALLNIAAAFVRETPSEVNENAQLTGRYQFFSDGKDPDACDITVPFHVPGPIKFERGQLTCFVGTGGTNIIIKAALIRALILNSEHISLNSKPLMVKDIQSLNVEFNLRWANDRWAANALPFTGRCHILDSTDSLYVLCFFLTKARASGQFENARRWDEKFHQDSLRWSHLCSKIDFAELPKSVVKKRAIYGKYQTSKS